jgi:hypothetical protein
MPIQFESVFARLRQILKKSAAGSIVESEKPGHYGLSAPTGPETVRIWRGKMRHPTIPVAWVEIGKSYVGYHLMGVYGNPKLLAVCSKELKARMQGKSCFNFKSIDEPLFAELERLTVKSLEGMKKAGFISEN